METFLPLITEVAQCFMDPIKKRTKLITHHQTIKEDLQDKNNQLSNLLSNIEIQASQAKNKGEVVTKEVNQWLEEARSAKDEANAWLTGQGDMNTKCGVCPNCCKRYKLSKEAIRKKESIVSLVRSGNFSLVSYPSSPKGIQQISNEGYTEFPSTKASLKEALSALRKTDTKIIGILGMGGIGKTTLVKQIGKEAEKEKMFDQVVFALVSQTRDIRNIQGKLGDMLGLTFSRESEIGRAGQLRDRIKYEDTILVILDDVWNTIDLAEIGIPFGEDHKGCKIVITTRRQHVCGAMRCDETISLCLLEEQEAWELFTNNAGGVPSEPSSELKLVAKQVMGECQRLPLALVVVARAMREKSLDEWISAAESLQRSRLTDIEGVDSNIYACFRLSYDFLKAEATKKCFLMCSLFPEDHEIDIEELAKYAMGFGLFQDTDSFSSIKSRVQSTIRDLKDSCLLLKTDNMSNHVKMHDLVRDAALWITSEDNELFIVPTSHQNNWSGNDKLGEAMAISLLACPTNHQFPIQAQCPRLKILLLAQRKPLRLSPTSFKGLATLRVLDLTALKYRLEMVLPYSLQCLQNLRTLLLRRWKLRGDISIIGSLRRLEILSLAGSLVVKLPKQFTELSELKILDLSGCAELADNYTEVQGRLPRLEVVYTPKMQMLGFENYDE